MGFGRERDENRGKFIDSNLAIFCYKQFEKLALCKSFSYIYFRLIKGKQKNFIMRTNSKGKHSEKIVENQQN